jgi:hypothetical protein
MYAGQAARKRRRVTESQNVSRPKRTFAGVLFPVLHCFASFCSLQDLVRLARVGSFWRHRVDPFLLPEYQFGFSLIRSSPIARLKHVCHLLFDSANLLCLENIFTFGLTHVTFGYDFNQPLAEGRCLTGRWPKVCCLQVCNI